MAGRPVLVVGTTSDYIDWIREHHPGRALFVTDRAERAAAREPAPALDEEVLTDLARPEQALTDLRSHLARGAITPGGVTAYDCESMLLASRIASEFALPYPASASIRACRSKLLSKELWQRAGVPCPTVARVACADDAERFFERAGGAVVLKPLTGSGSELVFVCRTRAQCREAYQTIAANIHASRNRRMYALESADPDDPDPQRVFVIESFVEGVEYSSDFILDEQGVRILRIARKVMARDASPGTTLAYEVPAALPDAIDPQRLRAQLAAAAHSLGLQRAMIMVDFIVRGDRALLIEMTPRPGGDCLPPLIRRSGGLDTLGAALDFAARRPVRLPAPEAWRRLAGLRILARRDGVIDALDDRLLRADPRVLECVCKVGPGHRVSVPPADYDSRILGHVIFAPSAPVDLEPECRQLAGLIDIRWRAEPGAAARRVSGS
jgi:biotin carboxylase